MRLPMDITRKYIAQLRINTADLRTKAKFVYFFLVINNYISSTEIKKLIKNLLSLNCQ